MANPSFPSQCTRTGKVWIPIEALCRSKAGGTNGTESVTLRMEHWEHLPLLLDGAVVGAALPRFGCIYT